MCIKHFFSGFILFQVFLCLGSSYWCSSFPEFPFCHFPPLPDNWGLTAGLPGFSSRWNGCTYNNYCGSSTRNLRAVFSLSNQNRPRTLQGFIHYKRVERATVTTRILCDSGEGDRKVCDTTRSTTMFCSTRPPFYNMH